VSQVTPTAPKQVFLMLLSITVLNAKRLVRAAANVNETPPAVALLGSPLRVTKLFVMSKLPFVIEMPPSTSTRT
jgi:hypothetical protein